MGHVWNALLIEALCPKPSQRLMFWKAQWNRSALTGNKRALFFLPPPSSIRNMGNVFVFYRLSGEIRFPQKCMSFFSTVKDRNHWSDVSGTNSFVRKLLLFLKRLLFIRWSQRNFGDDLGAIFLYLGKLATCQKRHTPHPSKWKMEKEKKVFRHALWRIYCPPSQPECDRQGLTLLVKMPERQIKPGTVPTMAGIILSPPKSQVLSHQQNSGLLWSSHISVINLVIIRSWVAFNLSLF